MTRYAHGLMRIDGSFNVGPRSTHLARMVGALVLSAFGAVACSTSSSNVGGDDSAASTSALAVSSTQTTSTGSTPSASGSAAPSSGASSTTLAASATKSSTSVSMAALSTAVVPTTVLASSSSTGLPDYLADLRIDEDEVVKFAPGATSIAVDGAVIRGERDVYHVGAGQGQTLELSISSLENNAVFDLFAPDGTLLAREVMASNTLLPADGDYTIVVGGTRGNATYELGISIPA